MSKPFEEWLVELAKNESFSILERLPDYLSSQYAKAANGTAERSRLMAYFRDHAPRTPFSKLVMEAIRDSR